MVYVGSLSLTSRVQYHAFGARRRGEYRATRQNSCQELLALCSAASPIRNCDKLRRQIGVLAYRTQLDSVIHIVHSAQGFAVHDESRRYHKPRERYASHRALSFHHVDSHFRPAPEVGCLRNILPVGNHTWSTNCSNKSQQSFTAARTNGLHLFRLAASILGPPPPASIVEKPLPNDC